MEHIRYFVPNAKGRGVRVACTCASGSPHGAEGWRSMEQAMASGRFDAYVPRWFNNPEVTRMCREYAEQGSGIESLRSALSLNWG